MTDGFDVFVQRRDRRDDDGAVGEVVRALSVLHGRGSGEGAKRVCSEGEEGGGRDGCGRRPERRPPAGAVMPPSPPSSSHFAITFGSTFAHSFSRKIFKFSLNILFESLSGTRSCGRRGPASEGSTVDEVELDRARELGLRRRVGAEEALLLRVRLDEGDEVGRPAREAQVRERLGVDGEEAHRRAVLGRHVRDRRAVRQRERGDAGAVELHELSDDALLAEHLRDGEDEVGRRRARGSWPWSRKPTTSGMSIDCGWPSSAASASMPPTPQPRTPRPLIIVVWLSVPTSVSGYARPSLGAEDDAREVLEVHLVADAGVGRHDAEVAERALAPAQERVTLLVALELQPGVRRERAGARELVDLHGVVDDEVGRRERIDLLRVSAERHERLAHRGEVDDRGHAREVLQEDARGREGDLLLGRDLRVAVREREDVLLRDRAPVLVAEQVLEKDPEGEGEARGLRRRLLEGSSG